MFELFINHRIARIIVVSVFILSFLVPLINLIQVNSGFSDLFRIQAPDGQANYLASKVFGLTAFILLWWQIIFGLSLKENADKKLHIVLGLSLVSLIMLHVILFFSAVSIRNEEYAFGLLVPNFASGYYKIALSLGIIALILLFFTAVSGLLMKRRSMTFKYGHKAVFLMFSLVAAHSYMIGSEIQSGLLLYILYFSVISIFFLLIVKFTNVIGKT